MGVERFLDTNILLYGYDLDAPQKRSAAMAILHEAWRRPTCFSVSVQVLQEFHVNFLKSGHSLDEAKTLIADFCHWHVVENSLELFGLGLALQERWQLSLWDAMILAAAQAGGTRELVSEDFNHGQDYGGIVAVNPFLDC